MSNDAPQAGEGPTLEQILAEAEKPPPVDWQETVGGILRDALPPGPDTETRALTYDTSDPLSAVAGIAAQDAGRQIGTHPVWVRFIRRSTNRHALLILSAPHPLDGADLIVVAHRGMFSRGLIRFACMWAFNAIGLTRVTLRVPDNRPDLADLARRAGFLHEGTARDLYGLGCDGQVWAMSAARCRWLPQAAPAIPPRDTSPPPSLKVH